MRKVPGLSQGQYLLSKGLQKSIGFLNKVILHGVQGLRCTAEIKFQPHSLLPAVFTV